MAIYCENVLLPKQVTHSFYATWLHCYEELFDASLTGKASHIKFELGTTLGRKDSSETLSLEKATLCGISLDCDLSGTYTQTETIHYEEEAEQEVKGKDDGNPQAENNATESSKSSYTSGRLFAGRKKTYRFSYNGDV
eukprot:gene4693-20984_t